MLWGGGGGASVPRDRTQERTQRACREQETPGSDSFIYWYWKQDVGWVNWCRNWLLPIKPSVKKHCDWFIYSVLIQEICFSIPWLFTGYRSCSLMWSWLAITFTSYDSSPHSQIGLLTCTPDQCSQTDRAAQPLLLGWNYSYTFNIHLLRVIITLHINSTFCSCHPHGMTYLLCTSTDESAPIKSMST